MNGGNHETSRQDCHCPDIRRRCRVLRVPGPRGGRGWTAQASWSVVGGLGDGPRPIDPQLGPVYPKHQGNIVQRPWTDMSYQEQLSRVNALLGGFLTRGVGV